MNLGKWPDTSKTYQPRPFHFVKKECLHFIGGIRRKVVFVQGAWRDLCSECGAIGKVTTKNGRCPLSPSFIAFWRR